MEAFRVRGPLAGAKRPLSRVAANGRPRDSEPNIQRAVSYVHTRGSLGSLSPKFAAAFLGNQTMME